MTDDESTDNPPEVVGHGDSDQRLDMDDLEDDDDEPDVQAHAGWGTA